MERYIPVKELPEDIQQLPHEDTVCRFCGISYLVHHEIKRLESTVQEKNQRLQQLEDLKAIWDKEKAELQIIMQHKEERLSVSQSSLDALKSELTSLRACHTALQSELNSTQKELDEKCRNQDARLLLTCRGIAAVCATVRGVRQHTRQLLRQSASQLAVLHSQMVQRTSSQESQQRKFCSELNSKITKLEEKLVSEQKQSLISREQWRQTNFELEEKLRKSQLEHQNLEAKLAASEKQLKAEVLESKKNQDEVAMLVKKLFSSESRLSAVRMESDRQSKEKGEETKSLQTLLNEARLKLSSTEKTLKERELVFLREKQSFIAEKQAMEVSLHSAEEEANKMRKENETLTSKSKQDIQQLQVIHSDEIASVTRQLQEQHTKELQFIENRCQKTHHNKLTEVKSSMAVAEMRHKREVQALQEDLKKEKDVFDQELHHHLEQVRMLELKLKEQQQEKEKSVSAATAALTCSKEELEAYRKQCSEMKNKLGMAYQEITMLQATVLKECEEREKLLSQLAHLRVL